MDETAVRLEDGTMFAPSVPFLEYDRYALYTLLVVGADQWLVKDFNMKRDDLDTVLHFR